VTAKETLNAARIARQNVERRKDGLKHLEELRELTTGSQDLEELIETVSNEISSMAETVTKAIYLIASVQNPGAIYLLWEYYINGAKNWSEAAKNCGYSKRHAMRLHAAALKELEQCG